MKFDETQCIRAIIAGDVIAFSHLLNRYQTITFTLAYRLLNNRELAEEVVQDAFLEVYRSLPNFREQSRFSTWFYRIVWRKALRAREQIKHIQTYDYEEVSIYSDEDNSILLIEKQEKKELVNKIIEGLPSEESSILTLYYLEEMNVEEIHEVTGLSDANIRVRLHRARKRFQQKWETLHLKQI